MARLSEQERARNALRVVRSWKDSDKLSDKDKAKYRQELQSLPSRILASGLGQTLAFYASKAGADGKVETDIGNELARFLAGEPKQLLDLLDDIVQRYDLAEYRRKTREALAYAEWLKRYAAALLPKREESRRTEGS
jgi:CRISPR-associated protein Cmr5